METGELRNRLCYWYSAKKSEDFITMRILYAASEARPFAASGGLADVAGSLPKALCAAGEEACVVMPYYVNSFKPEQKEKMNYITNFTVPVGWRSQYCGLFSQQVDGVTYFFIDNEFYFKRDNGLYGYYDDAERYVFFSRAVLEMLKYIQFKPQVINSNDWQCALIPVYYDLFYRNAGGCYDNIKHVFTIHNIGYQGQYGLDLVKDIVGIPPHKVNIIEYDGDINFMKGAIEVADKVTTVSPTYAKEILDPWFSHGLDRILVSKQYKTCGFLNGIDTEMYNPETDSGIAANFSAKDHKGKAACKSAIFNEFGMPEYKIPLLAMISRFADHKGFDLVRAVFDDIIATDMQVVILGSGESQYEEFFQNMHWRYPDKVGFYRGFNTGLAKRIYAGADMFLMPSKSEPCGLAQMISARYGTIPIVRATGGLKDSIVDYGDNGIGFTFQSYNAHDMLGAIQRAKEAYDNRMSWGRLVTRAMKADFSWAQSAKLYIGLYKELCGE